MATINVYSPFNDVTPEGNARVCVTYERDHCLVQVGIQRAAPDPRTDGHPTYDADGGTWTDLDRNGINRLIRALREARDKAFGKDE